MYAELDTNYNVTATPPGEKYSTFYTGLINTCMGSINQYLLYN